MNRQDKLNYYLDIADVALNRSTCLRRKYGAVIVKNDEIISTGYNGAPRGCANCIDVGVCRKQIENIPHGERYELCRSVHAEANAIISAGRKEMIGANSLPCWKRRSEWPFCAKYGALRHVPQIDYQCGNPLRYYQNRFRMHSF